MFGCVSDGCSSPDSANHGKPAPLSVCALTLCRVEVVRKGAIHEVGLKAPPQCHWGASVDPLMLLFTGWRTDIHKIYVLKSLPLPDERLNCERLWFSSRKGVCGSAKTWSCTLCFPWVFSLWDVLLMDWKKWRASKLEGTTLPCRCSVIWWNLSRAERGLTIGFGNWEPPELSAVSLELKI